MLRLTRLSRFATNAAGGKSLLLTLSSSHESLYAKFPVKNVTLPGYDGYFTVTSGHSPMMSTLKPGVVSFSPLDSNDSMRFFISSGFFLYKQNDDAHSAEVMGVEVVPLEQLDKDRATSVLQEVLSESQADSSQWNKVKAFLAQDLCASVVKALS